MGQGIGALVAGEHVVMGVHDSLVFRAQVSNATEVSDGLEVRLVGPSETIFESSIGGGLWINAGFGWISPVGADGLAAGTYEATVAYDHAVGGSPIEVNHVVVGYRR